VTGLFDSRDSAARARRFPAPGPPATAGETAGSVAVDLIANDLSISANLLLHREYEIYLEQVEGATGQQFDNPFGFADKAEQFTVDPVNPALQPLIDAGLAQPGTRARPKTAEEREAELLAELRKLQVTREARGLALEVRTPAEIRDAVVALRAQTRAERAEVAGREGGLGTALALATGAGVFLADPPVLASMALGAPAATSILRAAAIDAGIAAGVEVPIQASVQAARARLGEETSLSEAALNVLTVGAGGFVFSGLLRGAARGTRGLVKAVRREGAARTRAQKDALEFLERQVELQDATPFDRDLPSAKAEHEAKLSEAEIAVREGRAPRDLGEPESVRRPEVVEAPARPLREAVSFEEGPLADFEQALKAGGERMRAEALAEAARADAAKRTVAFVRAMVTADDDLAELLALIRRPPKVEGERLASFLAREGGIREERGALRALGLPKARPGLLRAEGLPLDEAGLRAFQAGFFRERPTHSELIEALGEDLGDRPRFTLEDESAAEIARSAQEFAAEAGRDLDELGIDLSKLSDAEASARLRELAARVPPEGEAPQVAPQPATARATAEVRAERAGLEAMEAEGETLDSVLEAQVRGDFEGRAESAVFLEDLDGNIVRAKVEDVLADLDEDEVLLREFRECIS
jgi:hypothetical protein